MASADEGLEKDIEECFSFLAHNDWIHNFQVTRVIKDKVLYKIPLEWTTHLQKLCCDELNYLPYVGTSSEEKYPHWPSSLHRFLSKAVALAMERDQIQGLIPPVVDTIMARGMNPKKIHEVMWMASLVNDICQGNCDLIVDIGSGLGYLDHVLHQVYGYRVLGLEISERHSSAAECRAVKQGKNVSLFKNPVRRHSSIHVGEGYIRSASSGDHVEICFEDLESGCQAVLEGEHIVPLSVIWQEQLWTGETKGLVGFGPLATLIVTEAVLEGECVVTDSVF